MALRVAFDSVVKDVIWSLLRSHGMPHEVETGRLPTLVHHADFARLLYGAHYQLGNLSASWPASGIHVSDGTRQVNPAIRPRRVLWRRAGQRDGFRSNDQWSSDKPI